MRAISLSAAAVGFALAACQAPEPDASPAPSAPAEPAAAAPAAAASAAADPALTTFLETYTREAMAPLSYVARTHGEGAEQLTFVYLVGPYYCGSGGCNLLILRREGGAYLLAGNVSVTRPPIRVLETETNGRPDIGVRVSGGGTAEGYEARLRFDGTSYPRNPTVAPAQRVDQAPGTTLITEDDPRVTLKE